MLRHNGQLSFCVRMSENVLVNQVRAALLGRPRRSELKRPSHNRRLPAAGGTCQSEFCEGIPAASAGRCRTAKRSGFGCCCSWSRLPTSAVGRQKKPGWMDVAGLSTCTVFNSLRNHRHHKIRHKTVRRTNSRACIHILNRGNVRTDIADNNPRPNIQSCNGCNLAHNSHHARSSHGHRHNSRHNLRHFGARHSSRRERLRHAELLRKLTMHWRNMRRMRTAPPESIC